ncbi:MAG: PepSY domain-containing protein [Candidatus Competibacteraceae bacterium]|nr:PepSY domain-containing protein [Candidatus Competibacteraceae bacterium]
MKKLLAATLLAFSATSVLAGPTCDVPKEKWMKEADFKAKVEADGYRIKTFKVSRGQCYEIYGFDKAGKKVEIYFNPETAAVLKSKQED